MGTRLLGSTAPSPVKRTQAPERRDDWKQLINKAISMAEAIGDRRLEGLKRAFVEGRAEQHLRLLGIIHDRDLDREFPQPKV